MLRIIHEPDYYTTVATTDDIDHGRPISEILG
jgi:hypothetical protein